MTDQNITSPDEKIKDKKQSILIWVYQLNEYYFEIEQLFCRYYLTRKLEFSWRKDDQKLAKIEQIKDFGSKLLTCNSLIYNVIDSEQTYSFDAFVNFPDQTLLFELVSDYKLAIESVMRLFAILESDKDLEHFDFVVRIRYLLNEAFGVANIITGEFMDISNLHASA